MHEKKYDIGTKYLTISIIGTDPIFLRNKICSALLDKNMNTFLILSPSNISIVLLNISETFVQTKYEYFISMKFFLKK